MNKKVKVLSLGFGLMGVAFLLPNSVIGKAQGPCVDCHTMHNSQDGDVLDGNPTPNGALTNKSGCIGCHTGTNTNGGNIPYVFSSVAPTYGTNTLAGGNFYWVDTVDSTGHNVVGISDADADLGFDPPGFNADFNANTQVNEGNAAWTTQLTCAGTNGCHGEHVKDGDTSIDDFTAISGSHHADDSAIDGSTTAKSFRFLYGIIGKEAADWEYTTSSTEHNQYFGVDRANDTPPVAGDAVKSINYLCAECHGNFHSGAGDLGADTGIEAASAWLRHPTDFDMNDLAADSEYLDYGTDGTYQPLAPVGTDRLTGGVVVVTVSNVFANNGDAIVNCISCHRAHGSPYADLLRWDYDTCEAGSDDAACGCFLCHTTKDAG